MPTPLQTSDDLDAALQRSHQEPVVLFKHSATCPISAGAHREIQQLGGDGLPLYQITVQQARPISNEVAERLGVRHESPQVLVVQDGEAVFHASHGAVTADAVRHAVAEHA